MTAGRLSPPLKKKMHVRLSNNTATRETLNGIEGIVSIKRMEHQPTSGGFGWSLAEEEPYSFRGASALQLAAPFSNNKGSKPFLKSRVFKLAFSSACELGTSLRDSIRC